MKKKLNYYAVLLAGGQGTRFWPLSRTLEPKQFIQLHKDESLFAQTIKRTISLIPAENIFIAGGELYRHQISEITKDFKIPQENLFFEPSGKNTAPSIAVTLALIHSKNPSARVAVLPCDHLISNKKRFLELLNQALSLCENNLVIFGIPPTRPATGYGYIEVTSKNLQEVKSFREKPDLLTAKKFIKNGNFYWNGGIFVGSAKVFFSEFKLRLPKLYSLIEKVRSIEDIIKIWNKIEPISFDYGVLEKAQEVKMLKASNLGWSDLGSWQAWDEISQKDNQGNLFKADVVNIDSTNTTVFGSNRLVATIGLDDLIIIDTPDALLITKKDKTEDVKKVVDFLKSNKRLEHYTHKTVKRPWGAFTVLEIGNGFKIKLVEVNPGSSLSLQYHNKRSEHWVVVEGKAEIVNGKNKSIFEANQSTYIPVKCVHRLSNPGKSILRIVEVQAGIYLEEDDIIRLKDNFGRI